MVGGVAAAAVAAPVAAALDGLRPDARIGLVTGHDHLVDLALEQLLDVRQVGMFVDADQRQPPWP